MYNFKLFSMIEWESVRRIFHGLCIIATYFSKSPPYIALSSSRCPPPTTVLSVLLTVSNKIYSSLLLPNWLSAISLVYLAINFLCLNRGGFIVGCSTQSSISSSSQEILKTIPNTNDVPAMWLKYICSSISSRDLVYLQILFVNYNYSDQHII